MSSEFVVEIHKIVIRFQLVTVRQNVGHFQVHYGKSFNPERVLFRPSEEQTCILIYFH